MRKPLVLCIGCSNEALQVSLDGLKDQYTIQFLSDTVCLEEKLNIYGSSVRFVLIDIGDPQAGDLLRWIGEAYLSIEVIGYSLNSDTTQAIYAMKNGAIGCIEAPFSSEKMRAWFEDEKRATVSQKIEWGILHQFPRAFSLRHSLMLGYEYLKYHQKKGLLLSADQLEECCGISKSDREFFPKESLRAIFEDICLGLDEHRKIAKVLLGIHDAHPPCEGTYCVIIPEALDLLSEVIQRENYLDIAVLPYSECQVISELKSKHAHLFSVVVLSPDASLEEVTRAFQAGADEVIEHMEEGASLSERVAQWSEQQFIKRFTPLLSQKYVVKHAKFPFRSTMAHMLCTEKMNRGDIFQMKDLYLFFPELQNAHIPGDVAIPKSIIQKGIALFVKDMLKSLPYFTACINIPC